MLLKLAQHSPDLCLGFSSQTSHCLSSGFLSDVIPCKRSSTSHSVSLFLTVWWLLSLLCCHGNLWETVGAHYTYSLSSPFENELSVFCLGWHEKHVLTPESWSLYIQDALTLESKKYVTANSVNLENLTGRSSSWTDIYTNMIYISSQFFLLMRNSWD